MGLNKYFSEDFLKSIQPLVDATGAEPQEIIEALAVARFAEHNAHHEVFNTSADEANEFNFDGGKFVVGRQLYENMRRYYVQKFTAAREQMIRADMEHVGFDGLNKSDQEFIRQLSAERAKRKASAEETKKNASGKTETSWGSADGDDW